MSGYEHDAEYGWIVENDGEGASRIVARDVLPSFGEWVADSLDAAWAEAEAALPEGPWMMELVRHGAMNGDENPYTGYVIDRIPDRYEAVAQNTWACDEVVTGTGPTPAAALRALAAELRQRERAEWIAAKPAEGSGR